MGNHGGGIPAGSGSKFHKGDHVRVHAGVHTGLEGKVRRMVGLHHVHIVPKTGRAVIAHVKNVAHGSVGVRTKHFHARVG